MQRSIPHLAVAVRVHVFTRSDVGIGVGRVNIPGVMLSTVRDGRKRVLCSETGDMCQTSAWESTVAVGK